MKQFVEYVARALVDNPDRVQVAEAERSGALVLELSVDPSDFGKIIGKQGRVCAAIRALLSCASGKLGRRIVLNILEPPDGRRPGGEDAAPSGEPALEA
ncbi:MAG: KH domain-containing protein [Verrucomicrobia bacterium]|nr:KH domain-containing protein [Verrucomicrobiota bacterium]